MDATAVEAYINTVLLHMALLQCFNKLVKHKHTVAVKVVVRV